MYKVSSNSTTQQTKNIVFLSLALIECKNINLQHICDLQKCSLHANIISCQQGVTYGL